MKETKTSSEEVVNGWLPEHELMVASSILTQRLAPNDPKGDHRIEIINL
jgi:hypothetical protein